MFFKESVFKKKVKEAYRGNGLFLAWLTDDELTIGGKWWLIQIKDEAITKKMKAAIIELTGEIPDKGAWLYRDKVITAEAETDEIEYTIAATKSEYREPVDDTGLMIEDKEHLKRAFVDEPGRVYCILEETMDFLCTTGLQTGEMMPDRPTVAERGEKHVMTWENNLCRLTVTCQELPEELEKAARGLCS